MIFSEAPLSEAPTANLLCPRCVFRQIEAAGILAGTDNRAAAEMFIDFLLSRPVQEDVPLSMFVYPVVAGTPIPQEFIDYSDVPESAQVVELSPETIAENQQRWLEQWTEVVLQGRDPEEVRRRGTEGGLGELEDLVPCQTLPLVGWERLQTPLPDPM